MKIKKIFYSVVSMTFAVMISVTVGLAAQESNYDGYLIELADDAPVTLYEDGELLELTEVIDGIYWTNEEQIAKKWMHSDVVETIEKNYYVSLYDADLQEAQYDWTYQAVKGEYTEKTGCHGEGIRVAVIDSGVDSTNKNLKNAKISKGYDYIENTDVMCDTVSHGTNIAQIMSGSGIDSAVYGLSKGVEIVPLRCFSTRNNGTIKTLVQAITDAVDKYHCDVINMSWGLPEDSKLLKQVIEYAYEKNTVLIAAAGNISGSQPKGTLNYPAAYDEVIGVGSVTQTLAVSSTSQNSKAVSICAPGASIGFINANGYLERIGGTSYAAPFVTAAAAVLCQACEDLTNANIMDILTKRAVDLGTPGYDTAYGYGFLRLDCLFDEPWVYHCQMDDKTILYGMLYREKGGSVVTAAYDMLGMMKKASLHSCNDKGLCSYRDTYAKDESIAQISSFAYDEHFCPQGEITNLIKMPQTEQKIPSDAGIYAVRWNPSYQSQMNISFCDDEGNIVSAEKRRIHSAAFDDYYAGAKKIDIHFTRAKEGKRYSILLLSDASKNPSKDNIAFITQKTAEHSEVDFCLYPSCLTEGMKYFLYLSTEDNAEGLQYIGEFSYALGELISCTHVWDKGIESRKADCMSAGEILFHCTICNETKTETIPKRPHHFTEYTYNNDAKIGVDGTETAYCIYGCGVSDVRKKAGTALSEPTIQFVDVQQNAYYTVPVMWAVEKGITKGTSETTFSPEKNCTRAQIVSFLWRLNGCPNAVNRNNPFSDVSPEQYYYNAVLWAVEKGITSGTSGTTFSPDMECSRGQAATFLWRVAGESKEKRTNPFVDVPEGAYYTKAVIWAANRGITKGTSEITFSPELSCTRGQIVTFLYRASIT